MIPESWCDNVNNVPNADGSMTTILSYSFKNTGPLLNPAMYIGQALFAFDFSSIITYGACPFAGGVLALVFYEFVFVKSQEYLNVNDNESEGSEGSKEDIGADIGGGGSKKKYMDDDDDATRIDAWIFVYFWNYQTKKKFKDTKYTHIFNFIMLSFYIFFRKKN